MCLDLSFISSRKNRFSSLVAGTQARVDKERYQQALSEYQQRLTLSEAGLEESQEEPFATFQPQGVQLCPKDTLLV